LCVCTYNIKPARLTLGARAECVSFSQHAASTTRGFELRSFADMGL
jgi:hypothetical protein